MGETGGVTRGSFMKGDGSVRVIISCSIGRLQKKGATHSSL